MLAAVNTRKGSLLACMALLQQHLQSLNAPLEFTLPPPFPSCSQHPFIGLLFMVGALTLETVLFIIRTSVPPKLHLAAARRATAARVARQAERQKREAAALEGAAGSAAGGGSTAEPGAASKAAKGGGRGGAGPASEPAKPAADKKED